MLPMDTFLGVGWWLLLLVMRFPEALYQHSGPLGPQGKLTQEVVRLELRGCSESVGQKIAEMSFPG